MHSAIILAAALVLSVAIYVYFSPYQSCVRGIAERDAHKACAALLGSGGTW